MSSPVVCQLTKDGSDFPYIVIEYFDLPRSECPSDTELGLLENSPSWMELPSIYKKDSDSFDDKDVELSTRDYRVYGKRWKYIGYVAVIEASGMQVYFSKSLNHPHYSIHPREYKSYMAGTYKVIPEEEQWSTECILLWRKS